MRFTIVAAFALLLSQITRAAHAQSPVYKPALFPPGTLARQTLRPFLSTLQRATQLEVNGKTTPFAPRLRALLLNDDLYHAQRPTHSPGPADYVLHFVDAVPVVTVEIWLADHEMRVHWRDGKGITAYSYAVNFDAIGAPLFNLLHEALPQDAKAQSLLFSPLPDRPTEELPAVAAGRAASILPGMTRHQLMQVFAEEGGMRSSTSQEFVLRPLPPAPQIKEIYPWLSSPMTPLLANETPIPPLTSLAKRDREVRRNVENNPYFVDQFGRVIKVRVTFQPSPLFSPLGILPGSPVRPTSGYDYYQIVSISHPYWGYLVLD